MAKYEIAIIGGGASAMVAAISAAEHSHKLGLFVNITIFEKQDRIGKKLLATGNGCCNLSNKSLGLHYYHGADSNFAKAALTKYDLPNTMDFFNSLGLITKADETGKIYPYSEQSAAVLDILRFKVESLGINVACNHNIKEIQLTKDGFTLTGEQNGQTLKSFANKVILAAGGVAAPHLGGSMDSYALACKLGHQKNTLFPSLVQIKTENTFTKALKGVKIEGIASILDGNKLLAKHKGELLFTEYGASGPPIFQLSRLVSKNYAENKHRDLILSLDLMPEYSEQALQDIIRSRKAILTSLTLENFLTGMLNKRLGQITLKAAGIAPLSRLTESLTEVEIVKLSHLLKFFNIPITGTMTWKNAQVTAGGLATNDFNPDTMESKIIAGFYACGEILDIDGDCGGYNLQWAWSSGRLAGISSIESLGKIND